MSRKLEITAISAEELIDGSRKPVKNAFVTFEVDGNYGKSPMTTNIDRVGGNFPMWKEKLETEISSDKGKSLYVKVYRRNSTGMDKHVGTARVPIKVFTGEYAPEGFLHCLSYRLWDESKRRNGIVNFSVRIVSGNKGRGFSGENPFWLR